MGRARVFTGQSTQGHRPDWGPLLSAVGEGLAGDFMWMFEVELSDGTPLQAYKHIDTRCYLHLDRDGETFVFEPPDRYRRLPLDRALTAVFQPLTGLASVSGDRVAASWALVERLRDSRG